MSEQTDRVDNGPARGLRPPPFPPFPPPIPPSVIAYEPKLGVRSRSIVPEEEQRTGNLMFDLLVANGTPASVARARSNLAAHMHHQNVKQSNQEMTLLGEMSKQVAQIGHRVARIGELRQESADKVQAVLGLQEPKRHIENELSRAYARNDEPSSLPFSYGRRGRSLLVLGLAPLLHVS